MNTTFILLSIGSLIFLIQAIPLALGVVKPNRFYGVRIKSTLSDDELWYRINKIYGKVMILSSIAFYVICFSIGSWRTNAHYGIFNFLLFIAQAVGPMIVVFLSLYRWKKIESFRAFFF